MNGSLTILTAQQVMVMALLILTGFVAVKAGAVKAEARTGFSDILVYIVAPAMIINSYIMEFDPSVISNLLKALFASTVTMLVGVIIAVLACLHNKDAAAPIMRYAMAAGNSGYMGFPLITALFGNEGLMYASMFLTVYNILVWTIGVGTLDKDKAGSGLLQSCLALIKQPALIAAVVGILIYITQIPVPEVIHQPLQLFANLNTPLSMFVTGMLMAGGGLLQTLKDKRLWETIIVRLICIPAAALVLCRLMGISGMVGAVVVLLNACPCASLTTVFAVRYHYDERLAAGLVSISTLLSIITLPIFASFL